MNQEYKSLEVAAIMRGGSQLFIDLPDKNKGYKVKMQACSYRKGAGNQDCRYIYLDEVHIRMMYSLLTDNLQMLLRKLAATNGRDTLLVYKEHPNTKAVQTLSITMGMKKDAIGMPEIMFKINNKEGEESSYKGCPATIWEMQEALAQIINYYDYVKLEESKQKASEFEEAMRNYQSNRGNGGYQNQGYQNQGYQNQAQSPNRASRGGYGQGGYNNTQQGQTAARGPQNGSYGQSNQKPVQADVKPKIVEQEGPELDIDTGDLPFFESLGDGSL